MVIKSVQSGLIHPVADTMKSNAAKESPIWPMTSCYIFSFVNVLEIKLSVSNMQWLMGHWSVVIFHSKLETGSIQNVLRKTESFFVKLDVDKMNRDTVCNQMMNIWRNMKNSIWSLQIMEILIKVWPGLGCRWPRFDLKWPCFYSIFSFMSFSIRIQWQNIYKMYFRRT